MKSVLISIQPKWCEIIAKGKKTIEVRKTRPKLETPFKCYIYCTKDERYRIAPFRFIEGWFIKRFDDNTTFACGCAGNMKNALNGKVIGEFVCDRIELLFNTNGNPANYMEEILPDILQRTALSYEEFQIYTNSRASRSNIYGWHISDLKIYDKPKELGEFRKPCPFNDDCDLLCHYALGEYHGDGINGDVEFVGCDRKIVRPPQSWQFVEELEQ